MATSGLSDVYRATPVHLSRKDHLDFESIQVVPDSHAWQEVDDYPLVDAAGVGLVPIVDLDDPNAMKLVTHACETWGVFQIVNHGVRLSLLQDLEAQGMRLFSLPVDHKLRAARLPDGISGYGLPRLSSFFSKLMWCEGFTIVGSPVEHARLLWPDDYKQFCDVIEEYQKEIKGVAGKLLWLLLGGLGITKPDLKWAGPNGDFEGANAALHLNSYPGCPDPNKAMGLAAHTDSTLLTVLYQSNASGLQVLNDGSTGWVTVPPLPEALVVNVGDLLHILSNGRFRSVLHRAVVNQTHHRLSAAYLYGPPSMTQIAPLEKLLDLNHPPLYKSVTWNEFLETKAKHYNKTLSLLRITKI